jgi:surfactin synthase thioesterase subunit
MDSRAAVTARHNHGSVAPPPPWIQTPFPRPDARLRLYCFPHAGSGAGYYRPWSEGLDRRIEVRAVLPPGRERRFMEPALSTVEEVVDGLVPALGPVLDPPYALFGHSLGAMVAFETARRLTASGRPPVHLFVSGAHAPHMIRGRSNYRLLPDAEFRSRVHGLGGTPPELAENDELVDLMLPTLRADFAAAETYLHLPDRPLPCPVTAFTGTDDPLARAADLDAWAAHAGSGFRRHDLPGDHFFVTTARPELLAIIQGELAPHLAGD